ncbi:phosphotransferase enzyme family protein [Ruminococcus flavefaciens]|uniref:Phosphotransferase enzyme family protein n=1 Tax=Ruminococcus flavefaciens TaxID=1265 RepID=A0A1M7JKP2_RUMFL|nr:aminoglycoside phosphotransferase family protein [Ruminococcus flavefaciens]SHM53471.1 Phosphotransferase enzyme family protein [Ruminococcus flavefaciens]
MDIRNIPQLFSLPEAAELTELNKGHINGTYLAVCGGKKYILQSLNRAIFRAPEAVMENISRIEAAFVECGSDVAVPHFIASGDKIYAVADEKVWRIYEYITATADAAAEPAAAGRAFGTFIRTMEGSKLSTVPAIEGFHDYDGYFAVLVSKSGIDRSVMVTLDRLRDTLGQVFDSSMKKRIIHGDAKADNIIVSEKMTIIDLDTAMYGYAAIDYGDLVRSVCRNVISDLNAVREITSGFAQGLGGILSDDEVNSLYYGILWLTGELAVRYLIDYRSENKYFRGKTSAQCLARAEELLSQLKQFTDHGEELKEIVRSQFYAVPSEH